MSGPGDNHVDDDGLLLDYIQRMASAEDYKQEAMTTQREVKAEAKANGYDPKALAEAMKVYRDGNKSAVAETYETKLKYLRAIGVPV